MSEPVSIFICNAPEDAKLRADLLKHLAIIQRNKEIRILHADMLQHGERIQVRELVDQAEVVLLLISADLLAMPADVAEDGTVPDDIDRPGRHANASEIALAWALHRYAEKQVRLIPVILYRAPWKEDSRFGGLVALPRDEKPVGEGSKAERDAAWTAVVQGIRQVATTVQQGPRTARTSPAPPAPPAAPAAAPVATAASPSPAAGPAPMSKWKRDQLARELDGLQQEASLLLDKINRLRQAMATTSDPGQKFSIQQNIKTDQQRLDEIERRMQEIETQLAG